MIDSVFDADMPILGDSVEPGYRYDDDDTELTFEYTSTITNAEADEDGTSNFESSDNPLDTSTLVEGDSIVCSAVASDGQTILKR